MNTSINILAPLLSSFSKGGLFQVGSNPGNLEAISYALHLVGVVFSISLFALSLYAWSRRHNRSLIFVSAAFFVFFVAIFLDEILPESPAQELLSAILELVILSLFFLTVVIGIDRRNREPKEKMGTEDSYTEPS